MKKLKILLIIIILLGIFSALYMQLNLAKGELIYYSDYEFKGELSKALNAKDFMYVPIWGMLLASTLTTLILSLSLLGGKHSYYSIFRFVVMMFLSLASIMFMMEALRNLSEAQGLTSKTVEYVYGFWFLMLPFIKSWALQVVVYVIKMYNIHCTKADPDAAARFKILKQVIFGKNLV